MLLRWSDEAPFLTVGLYEPPIISGAVHNALRASLLDAHMAPLVDRVHERVRLGRRTLLGSLASGIAHGLSRAADSLRGPALPIAETLLSTLDIADLVELTAQCPAGASVSFGGSFNFGTPPPGVIIPTPAARLLYDLATARSVLVTADRFRRCRICSDRRAVHDRLRRRACRRRRSTGRAGRR